MLVERAQMSTYLEGLCYKRVKRGPVSPGTDHYWTQVELLLLLHVLQRQTGGTNEWSSCYSISCSWHYHTDNAKDVLYLPLLDLQCGPVPVHTTHPAGKTHSACQLETYLQKSWGITVSMETFYNLLQNWVTFYILRYLDLCNHLNWGWRTWWGTYSAAASVMAPEGTTGLKAGMWMRWDRRRGDGTGFLSSNDHSQSSASPLLTRICSWKHVELML